MPPALQPDRTAIYIRHSDEKQTDEHQRQDIAHWLDRRDLTIGDLDIYNEQASGASEDRDDFRAIIDAIEDDQYDHVIVWEISRIARKGLLAQEFFDACEDSETVIHITDGSVREIRPDGHGRLVADIIASVAAEERRQLIRRTQSGLRRARSDGKWLGQVPAGFTRSEDGYLKPNIDPDYDNDETGYLDIVNALADLDADRTSYRQAARTTPNVTRQTLSNIHQDDERRRWYIDDEEPRDDRVSAAIEDIEIETETLD